MQEESTAEGREGRSAWLPLSRSSTEFSKQIVSEGETPRATELVGIILLLSIVDKIHYLSECHENREHCQEITRIRKEEREDVLLLKKELTTETNTWARKPMMEEAATP